ncbi:flavin-containing monooxygenase [Pelagibaculum spongiae]|uniref:4-hydroxyacetophenone monooxygenase n=1 Tax=Pelagibaculum spongiae TaxID=2080658 RepID=A0A2V1GYA5_9GAMM|nr:NAD(P)/FAD-dependent oxidoreductase [Pelagibaculum spongiae]PVZ72091.1 4-hydroxyacetophenone monooxygenase [Pelagibaculum spongiae]
MSIAHLKGTSNPKIIIIGSGFAGIGMAIRLKQSGINQFILLEKASSVGGTWRDNHYPGAACDVQSHLYSFSFEAKPDWSHMFGKQSEILSYIEHCVEKYQLAPHLRFGCEISGAEYDQANGLWNIQTKDGQLFSANEIISASGGLSQPTLPNILGIEKYQKESFHSSRWNHNFSVENKTISVIGTGASAIQFVPELLKQGAKVKLFQRTPPWILPKPDRKIGKFEQNIYKKLPILQNIFRQSIFWKLEARATGMVNFPWILKIGQKLAKRHLKKIVKDPVLCEKLTPNYTIGCKRILLSNNYLQAMQHPNLELITDAVTEITEQGVSTANAEHSCDAIIYGTGFSAAENCIPFPVTGKNQQTLSDYWKSINGAEAYKGISVNGFPNWSFIVGPNTLLGHSSIILMIEPQVEHILRLIKERRIRNLKSIEVSESAQQEWNKIIRKRSEKTVWQSGGCQSWYLTKDGKNTTLWPGFTFEFKKALLANDISNYQLEEYTASSATADEQIA